MALITVKAAPGIRVPKEDAPREYITDQDSTEVPASMYYRRRLAEGDLIEVTPDAPVKEPPVADEPAAGDAPLVSATAPQKSRKTTQEKAS
jgi:hypothetical protein